MFSPSYPSPSQFWANGMPPSGASPQSGWQGPSFSQAFSGGQTYPGPPHGVGVIRQTPACVSCQRSHVGCDRKIPCSRCVRIGKADECVPATHKKRGWRRGRKRDKQTMEQDGDGDLGSGGRGSSSGKDSSSGDAEKRSGESSRNSDFKPSSGSAKGGHRSRSRGSSKKSRISPFSTGRPSILTFFFETQKGLAISLEGKFVQVSPAFAEMLQVVPSLLKGRNIAEFLHPEDRLALQSELQTARHQTQAQVFTLRLAANMQADKFVTVELSGRCYDDSQLTDPVFVAACRLVGPSPPSQLLRPQHSSHLASGMSFPDYLTGGLSRTQSPHMSSMMMPSSLYPPPLHRPGGMSMMDPSQMFKGNDVPRPSVPRPSVPLHQLARRDPTGPFNGLQS